VDERSVKCGEMVSGRRR